MLTVHFLNVGHGDCTVIDFPSEDGNRLSVVDVNTDIEYDDATAEELHQTIVEEVLKTTTSGINDLAAFFRAQDKYKSLIDNPLVWLPANFPGRSVFRFIATHPHMDHISGFSGLFCEESTRVPLLNLWTLDHNHEIDNSELSPSRQSDWRSFRDVELGREQTSSHPVRVLRLKRGASNEFYTQDCISILSPSEYLIQRARETGDWNIASYVLRVQYGNCVTILGGDASEETWQDIVDNVPSESLKCNVLKASHHGRDSGFHRVAVNLMSPDVVILSVGKKPENDAHQKYKEFTDHVFSTRFKGRITAQCQPDGNAWIFDCEGNLLNQARNNETLRNRLKRSVMTTPLPENRLLRRPLR